MVYLLHTIHCRALSTISCQPAIDYHSQLHSVTCSDFHEIVSNLAREHLPSQDQLCGTIYYHLSGYRSQIMSLFLSKNDPLPLSQFVTLWIPQNDFTHWLPHRPPSVIFVMFSVDNIMKAFELKFICIFQIIIVDWLSLLANQSEPGACVLACMQTAIVTFISIKTR